MPSLVGREPICRHTDLTGHDWLELIVCNFQESQQFPNQKSGIAFIDQSKAQIKRSPPDTNIRVAQTFEDSIAVSLYGIGLDCYNFDQGVQRDVANVIIPVGEK